MEGGSATTRATNSVWSAMTCLALLCFQTLKSMVAAPDFKPVDLATAAKCTFPTDCVRVNGYPCLVVTDAQAVGAYQACEWCFQQLWDYSKRPGVIQELPFKHG